MAASNASAAVNYDTNAHPHENPFAPNHSTDPDIEPSEKADINILTVWKMAFLPPSPKNFWTIAHANKHANLVNAMSWMALSLIPGLLLIILFETIGSEPEATFIIQVVGIALIYVIAFLFTTFAVHLVAALFNYNYRPTHSQFAYAAASVYAPLQVVGLIIGALVLESSDTETMVNVLVVMLAVGTVLELVVLRGVYVINWLQAVGSMIGAILIFVLLFYCSLFTISLMFPF